MTIYCYGLAQSLTPTRLLNLGCQYSTNAGVSLSWNWGEIATETSSNGGYILTQGFQQPVEGVIITGVTLTCLFILKVRLPEQKWQPLWIPQVLLPLSPSLMALFHGAMPAIGGCPFHSQCQCDWLGADRAAGCSHAPFCHIGDKDCKAGSFSA